MMDEDKGFVVKDRRTFKDGVTDADDRPEDEAPDKTTAAEPESGPSSSATAESAPDPEPTVLPPVDFSMLVVSLSSSAATHLGLMPDLQSGETVRNLPLAKQTIDILGMLQEKTAGNLSEDEKRMLESILFDLRLHYVNICGG